MKKNYIVPQTEQVDLETSEMIALSTMTGEADPGSNVLSKEDDNESAWGW